MSIDVELEQRLDEIEEKVEQSHKMLRSIKRKQTLEFWFGVIKVLVFVGVFYSAWLFIEPLFNQAKDAYIKFQGLGDSVESIKGNPFFEYFSNQGTTSTNE